MNNSATYSFYPLNLNMNLVFSVPDVSLQLSEIRKRETEHYFYLSLLYIQESTNIGQFI